jgi:toxin-antitoxin system PIN domain toxin
MRALLDVNVLVALFDEDHASHAEALRWFDEHAAGGWATSPITQNGCIRVMSQSGYPNSMPVTQIAERLHEAISHRSHEFWADDTSILDPAAVEVTRIHGPKQLTDVYLLALSVAHEGRLVTFDRSIPLAAVKGAQKKHLVVL